MQSSDIPEGRPLDGGLPLVIGHRGASGSRPEHTLEAYRLAIELGADIIEPDLVTTRDGVLIARHENLLAQVALDEDGDIVFGEDGRPVVTQATTDVAEFDGDGDGAPDFLDRLSVKVLDGDPVAGWFSEDFTLAEIKQLSARERIPDVRPENAVFDDQFGIPTFEEVIQLVRQVEAETGRKIGIIPETKHPTYFEFEGTHQDEDADGDGTLDDGEDANGNGQLDVVDGGSPIGVDTGRVLVETVTEQGFADPGRVTIQSFEVANLLELQDEIMPAAGIDLPLVQLLGDVEGAFFNEAGGGFSIPYDIAFNANPDKADLGADLSVYDGLPFEVTGETDYADLVTPEALKQIADAYAEGIGPWTDSFIIREPLETPVDADGDGRAQVTSRLTGEIRPLVADAHEAGLKVTPYTVRAEEPFLALEEDGTAQTLPEQVELLTRLGVDGIFTDQPGAAADVLEDLTGIGDRIRVATYNASLNRAEEGELIDDLSTGADEQARKVAEIIQRTDPDIVLVNEFDYDAEGKAADLFRDNYLKVGQNGQDLVDYPYQYVAASNTGVPSGFDLDNNGSVGGPNDAYGFGAFPGQFAFVIYSKHPIVEDQVRTFQEFLWKDMPDARIPEGFYSDAELDVLRLSSKNHVDVPVEVDGEIVHVLAAHPTPPVFDGPEDRNGLRNYDEIRFWDDYVTPDGGGYIYDDAGNKGGLGAGERFVIVGDYNTDPFDGDSVPGAAQQIVGNPWVDPTVAPDSEGAVVDSFADGGVNLDHLGHPGLDTADFSEPPGNLRVDYVLPSANGFEVEDAGVFWPAPGRPGAELIDASDHRLVWSDLRITEAPAVDVKGVEFQGAAFLATGTEFEGTEIGGLSALTWDPERGVFHALSDSRGGETGAPRFYTLELDLADGRFANDDLSVTGVTFLSDADGEPFADAAVDPEGLAYAGSGKLYLSSEGDASAVIPPFVNEFSLEGRQTGAFDIPEKFLPAGDGGSGIRNNLAFESLTLTPDERTLYSATENALAQDGSVAGLDQGSPSRILAFDTADGTVKAEYLYETHAVAEPPVPEDAFATNGLVDLLALDNTGTLLALERSFSTGVGNTIKLYEARIGGADDISGIEALDGLDKAPKAVEKELVFDFAGIGLPLDNVEGMALGPVLPDGRQSLTFVSDNNFSDTQFTQFLVFALDQEGGLGLIGTPPAE
ncbi:esterase-like activity of phytase family protein [Skermanella mucosa]|uniref:esterase-like activity of phytase family protein n=1 Tax=Skermanella mucosa TaxID=1789672 RepID=UPI001E5248B2|nr:esterase-like activity of phytase family protein [Skermanella mucosa]UEM22479.1 esterase-like activity of phytase family protein [Skermanella mucosa]